MSGFNFRKRRNKSSPAPSPGDDALEVLWEDEDIIAVDKPAGVYAHPAPGHENGTVSQIVLSMRPEIANVGSEERPGIVHRLDAETSGVMILAKTQRAYLFMRKIFMEHRHIVKTYLAVLNGTPSPREGVLCTNIGRKPWDPHRMAVDAPGGRPAVTRWRVLSSHGGISLVEFKIETGRMHQIRVHAAHLECPVVGDKLYGDKLADAQRVPRPQRHLLHAVRLEFIHPFTNKRMKIQSPPPPDLIYIR